MLHPSSPPPTLRVELNVRTMWVAILGIALVWAFLQLWPVLLVVLVALMIAGALTPLIHRLERLKVRRPYAITLVFGGLIGTIVAFAALTLPTLAEQLAQLITHLPESKNELAQSTRIGAPFARSLRQTRVTELVNEIQRFGLAYSSKVLVGAAYALSALFLSLYLLIDSARMRGSAFALIPRAYHMRVSRILLNLELIVGGYVRGQVITSLLMMGVTFVVLLVAEVPNALALALFAALADALPYIGAFLACIPAFIAALPNGTTTALIVLGVLAAYQEFETRFVVPRVYGRALRLPAAIVMVALLIGGKLLGVLGALLALPIAAGVRMIGKELHFTLPGDDRKNAAIHAFEASLERDFEARTVGMSATEAAAIAIEIAVRARDEHVAEVAARRGAAA